MLLKNIYDQMTRVFPNGKCITFMLNQVGWPATRIAENTKTSISHISLMINGLRTVTPAVKAAISDALGFDPWEAPVE